MKPLKGEPAVAKNKDDFDRALKDAKARSMQYV